MGIGMDAESPDIGRAKVSGDEKDTGAFKTPTLLDIAESGPYFHNGSAASLEDAVQVMLDGGKPNQWLDEENLRETKEAELTEEEVADLLAFLRELNVDYDVSQPELP